MSELIEDIKIICLSLLLNNYNNDNFLITNNINSELVFLKQGNVLFKIEIKYINLKEKNIKIHYILKYKNKSNIIVLKKFDNLEYLNQEIINNVLINI